MIIMAVALLLIVGLFFVFFVFPGATAEASQAFEQFSRGLAATSPDYAAANDMAHRVHVEIRYEGPHGSWSTNPRVPSILAVKTGRAQSYLGREYLLEPAPDGGSYLFVWNYGEHVRSLHEKMLWLLFFLVTGVVCTAFIFQHRLLRPVRLLDDGVQRLSTGDLDVAVPVVSRNEFGALTDAFNKMVGRVRQMIQARDQLLLDVSHELRSPLTRLKVAVALLPDDDNKAGLVEDLNEMEVMISELLELERIRNGHGLRRERQDLMSLLRQVAEAHGDEHPGVRLSAPSLELFIDIDREKIRTVMRNLLENARKFSLPDSRPVEVHVAEEDGMVRVQVRDDGPGIPAIDLPNLFEPFYRVDRSRSRKTGGYGLGLSICKRIMEAHGGGIAVSNNNPGRGATFVLLFPTPE
ncbi:MAG TPA: HAMP domain-containing sensor histidine kinase [Terracidiphilus sp.]|nr:HAMP domain-containing sensor histidine kinase [Terracidiphilus sp.]